MHPRLIQGSSLLVASAVLAGFIYTHRPVDPEYAGLVGGWALGEVDCSVLILLAGVMTGVGITRLARR